MKDQELFSTDTAGLMQVETPQLTRLRDGDRLRLGISPVRKTLDGAELRMLAYNGSIPGPTLRVEQGAEIAVDVRNDGDVETTVHWHGLRLENRYDGVPHETQEPIPVGGSYSCHVQFPDPGFYWYHPHIREDFAQEMGLYGTIVVEPTDAGYWPAVDRELTLTLDDLLVEDGQIASFRRSGPNFTAMGRFGNVLLINGETEFSGEARQGEVIRLYLVNTANTRIFNFAVGGARTKLVGGDSGRYEHETFVDEVLLAPSERAVLDVLFDTAGDVRLEHRTPDRVYDLGAFSVTPAQGGEAAASFSTLRTDPDLTAERSSLEHDLERSPDKVLAFFSRMPLLYPDTDATASSYVCPMHPEVTASEPATCPQCGMKLVPSTTAPSAGQDSPHGHDHGDGLEWEDLMPEINRASDPSNMIWQLVDRETGAENGAISWSFTVGDRVKIRLVNEMDSDHPMHHPFHIHGAGRFLILARDGEPEPNLVWKDTVLVRAGRDGGHPAGCQQPGLVDGALPHRRTHRERDDVQLQRGQTTGFRPMNVPPTGRPLDVLVIGGGQAGLAMGQQLAQRRMRFEILDSGPDIGHVWRSRWDSLRLFTPGRYDNLPGMPFPGAADAYPGKDDVAVPAVSRRARQVVLPHALFSAVYHAVRRDVGGVRDALFQPAPLDRQPGSGRGGYRRAEVAERTDAGQRAGLRHGSAPDPRRAVAGAAGDHHLVSVDLRRLRHRDLSGRAGQHLAGILRGRADRRRIRLEHFPAYHAAAALSDDVFPVADRHHRDVPGVYADLDDAPARRA